MFLQDTVMSASPVYVKHVQVHYIDTDICIIDGLLISSIVAQTSGSLPYIKIYCQIIYLKCSRAWIAETPGQKSTENKYFLCSLSKFQNIKSVFTQIYLLKIGQLIWSCQVEIFTCRWQNVFFFLFLFSVAETSLISYSCRFSFS